MKMKLLLAVLSFIVVVGAIWVLKPGPSMKLKPWECIAHKKSETQDVKLFVMMVIPETKEYITYMTYKNYPVSPLRFFSKRLKDNWVNTECPDSFTKENFMISVSKANE